MMKAYDFETEYQKLRADLDRIKPPDSKLRRLLQSRELVDAIPTNPLFRNYEPDLIQSAGLTSENVDYSDLTPSELKELIRFFEQWLSNQE